MRAGYEEAFGWLGDVEESEPKFLAYPYIVKGALTVLDGNMGQGKSTFTMRGCRCRHNWKTSAIC